MKAFVNADIYTANGVFSDHALIVENDKIKTIVARTDIDAKMDVEDLGGKSIAPGFVDLQVNGGGGVLFNDSFDAKSVKTAVRAHQLTGATSIFPTAFTATLDAMKGLYETCVGLRSEGFQGIAGIHYEGPVINSAKAGVHDKSNILRLDREIVDFYIASAKNIPTFVTLAPEEVELSLVKELRENGVLVFAGHTNASYDEMIDAMNHGLQGATHLYNAMSALGSRAPGVVGAVLSRSNSLASIILDGHHLHWASFKVAFDAMDEGSLFFVTDAMPCVGSDITEFKLGDLEVFVGDGRCETSDGTLAGSALTMARAVKNAVQKVGVPRSTAIKMASHYPAKFAELSNVGDLKAGVRADFVVFSNELDVADVYVGGEKVS